MTIKVRCSAAAVLDIDQLIEFQGDLKVMSKVNAAKLRRVILRQGFTAPFFVWKKGSLNYVLDGHQRLKVLKDLRSEGCEVPSLPVAYIKATDENDAKRKLLEIVSQYGKVRQPGFDSFVEGMDVSMSDLMADLMIPDIKFLNGVEDETDVPESAPRVVELGDLWRLGEHRLLIHLRLEVRPVDQRVGTRQHEGDDGGGDDA